MQRSSGTILLVEDSAINRKILHTLLAKQGYEVCVAHHGKEALSLLAHERPDLILLDILMPEMDGLELCRLLKQNGATRDIPVIFISSLDHTDDILKGFAVGGVDYITKPFQPGEVLARVHTHLQLCRLQRQLEEKNRLLEAEKQKSEALLLNVLPVRVARALMETGYCAPQLYDAVTVCFVDIVQFTTTAATLSPETLINELNEVFTAFDRIVEINSCERMKTIGDAYLFVSGISEANRYHARSVATAALEMVACLRERNQNVSQSWQVRVGMHSGSVVGGIVGTRKYLFDIFGDTVNIAARMEALSQPMRIHVSAEVHRLLHAEFVFSSPMQMTMKGKGVQSTWFLEGWRKD
ncbi:adenylate/guanylate cyclase domain-containing protein [Desulfobulbus alkaliphilus]|uniref:adenylate/guanylate cyclase domain-containing protein n=1 Tax=Desulfobulbus alkaliphilus TaxID=869814 RepID=UPI0019627386|nr:adenylate/guanylate cyclase domain-containing protein [Desulfobulbus alkaliphilus]MBM9536009.1 response regulator [Desulfobulbus alkaliphilus]